MDRSLRIWLGIGVSTALSLAWLIKRGFMEDTDPIIKTVIAPSVTAAFAAFILGTPFSVTLAICAIIATVGFLMPNGKKMFMSFTTGQKAISAAALLTLYAGSFVGLNIESKQKKRGGATQEQQEQHVKIKPKTDPTDIFSKQTCPPKNTTKQNDRSRGLTKPIPISRNIEGLQHHHRYNMTL